MKFTAFVVSLLLCTVAASEHYLSVDILNCDMLQPGNHSYRPKTSTVDDKYTVLVSVEDDFLGVFLTKESAKGLVDTKLLGIPFYTLTLRNATSGAVLTSKVAGEIALGVRHHGFHNLIEMSSVPKVLRVEVVLHEVTTSRFEFSLQNILSVADGTYDMKPGNTSLGTYFVMTLQNSSITWYLKRRPPIPDFVFTLHDDEGTLLHAQILTHVAPDGVGIRNLLNIKDYKLAYDKLLFSVEFRERFRGHHAVAVVEDIQELNNTLVDGGAGETILTSTRSEEVKVLLQYHSNTRHISAMVIQLGGASRHIRNLQLRVSNSEGRTLFLEEEGQVPYIEPSARPQFGWYQVIPIASSSLSGKLTIDVYYDLTEEKKSEISLLTEWIEEYGANIRNFTVTSPTSAIAAVHLPPFEQVGSVPYRVLLTQTAAREYRWFKHIVANESWTSFVETHKVTKDAQSIAAVTLMLAVKASSPLDGINFRLLADHIESGAAPAQPVFWTPSERKRLLGFSYILKTIELQDEIFNAEYNAIGEAIPWFLTSITKEKYLRLRVEVAARMLNASGVLVLPPFIDFLAHDDAANLRINFDGNLRKVTLTTLAPIPPHTRLTMNYGTETKSKQDFLAQYGYVPMGARDATVVNDVLVTSEKYSRWPLYRKVLIDQGTDKGTLEWMLTLFQEKLSSLPTRIDAGNSDPKKVRFAKLILESERVVVQRHIEWLQEDIAEL